jgi:hypothetical protein
VLVLANCGGDDDSSSSSAGDTAELLGPERPAEGRPVKIGLFSDGDFATGERAYELVASAE